MFGRRSGCRADNFSSDEEEKHDILQPIAETEAARAARLQLIALPSPVVRRVKPAPPMVVHLKRAGGVEVVSCDVYIGRSQNQGGWHLPTSKWANPFTLKKFDNDRDKVLAAYEAHVRSKPSLMESLPELAGKRLGCWCYPLSCHGDVLTRLFIETVL